MAFTTARTWVVGELVSAAMMNEQVRDNLVDLDGRFDYGGCPVGSTPGDNYYLGPSSASVTMTGDELVYYPLWLPKATFYDLVAINVVTGAASSTVRVGFYNDSGRFRPTTLFLEVGSFTTTAVGNKTLAFSTATPFGPGTLWIAAVRQGAGNPTLSGTDAGGLSNFKHSIGRTTSGVAVVNSYYAQAAVSGALPASVGTLTTPVATSRLRTALRVLR